MTALAGTKGARRAVARGLSLGKRAKVVALLKKLAPAKSKADFVAEADCLVGSQGLAHINDLPRLKDCSSKKAADEARRLCPPRKQFTPPHKDNARNGNRGR